MPRRIRREQLVAELQRVLGMENDCCANERKKAADGSVGLHKNWARNLGLSNVLSAMRVKIRKEFTGTLIVGDRWSVIAMDSFNLGFRCVISTEIQLSRSSELLLLT
jgi:hypothetical protein